MIFQLGINQVEFSLFLKDEAVEGALRDIGLL